MKETSAFRRTKQIVYPEVVAGGFSRVDGTVDFYQRINSLMKPTDTVLDIGAGRGQGHLDDDCNYRKQLRTFRGRVGKVIGIDVDTVVVDNPSLDEAYVIKDDRFPLADASVDLAFSDHTFEHVADPYSFAQEVHRVLKPGGWLCARTPNRRGYISLASRIIPDRLHAAVLKRAQPGRKAEDVFPTTYLLNTSGALSRYFPDDAWERYVYTHNPEPAYFGTSPTVWRIFDTLLSALPRPLWPTLMIFMRKRADGENP